MNNPVTLLVVKSLKTSKAFYIDVLGMALIEEYDDCIKLQFGNHDIIIFQGIN